MHMEGHEHIKFSAVPIERDAFPESNASRKASRKRTLQCSDWPKRRQENRNLGRGPQKTMDTWQGTQNTYHHIQKEQLPKTTNSVFRVKFHQGFLNY